MEIKINKDINKYKEEVVLGLDLRQTLFAGVAIIISTIVVFYIYKKFGMEIATWIGMIAVSPILAFGFIRYNGYPLERFLYVYIKQKFIDKKKLVFKSKNYYNLLLKKDDDKKRKGKGNVKNRKAKKG